MKNFPKKWPTRFSQLLYISFFSLSFFGTISASVRAADIEIPYDVVGDAFDFSQNVVSHPVCDPDASGISAPNEVGVIGDGRFLGAYPDTSSPNPTGFGVDVVHQAAPFISGDPWLRSQYSQPQFAPWSMADGTYWTYGEVSSCGFPHTPTGDRYYFQFTISGGHLVAPTPPPPDDTSTHIIDLNPTFNEATSSDPAIFGTYYNQNEVYNQLLINLSWVEPSVNPDLLLSGLAHRQFIFDIGTSTSIESFSTTTSDLLTGRWLLSAQFSNGTDGFNSFTATTSTFIVGTTTTFFSDYVEYATTTATTTQGAPISSCTEASSVLEKVLCSLGDRIRDVLQFLFVPDATVVGRFGTLKDSLLSRVPFGYFPLFKEALSGVSASSTPIFAMVVPVSQIPRFNDLRTGLGWVFMFWFVVHMWRRFKHVQL